jgi:hypothetical protein
LTLDPEWKNSDPGSGINIPDPQHCPELQNSRSVTLAHDLKWWKPRSQNLEEKWKPSSKFRRKREKLIKILKKNGNPVQNLKEKWKPCL